MRNVTILAQNINNNNDNTKTLYDNAIKIINDIWDVSFVLLPCVGYIHQYMKIVSLKNTEGFSKKISFINIMSNLFRIFFWFGEHYEKTILLNSIIGIILQLPLLRICIKFDKKLQKDESIYRFFNLKEFWNWPYFLDYLFFLVFISSFISTISSIIGYENKLYVFLLGTISTIIGAFTGIPQIYELYTTKNPNTISFLLIFWWLSGDIFKFLYFFLRNTPIILKMCVLFQLNTNIVLALQIIYYRYFGKNSKVNIVSSEDNKKEENNDDIQVYKSIKNEIINNSIYLEHSENYKFANEKENNN